MRDRQTSVRRPALEPVEVSEGFVIFDDAYVPPPYTIQWEWPAVAVNGRAVLATQQTHLGPRSFAGGRGDKVLPRRHVEYVANHLRGGGLILCRAEQAPVLVTPGRALTILAILIGEDSRETKVQNLAAIKGVSMSPEEWAGLAETLAVSPELAERLEYYKTEFEAIEIEDMSASPRIFQMMTLAGFALAAWALGTLLRCRPPLGCDDAQSETPGLWDRQVVRLVLVIVVLGSHDLVCTLYAHDLGDFQELNPLAAPLLAHAPTVVAFKLSLTIGAAIVFLVARSLRLVQIGSWWMGLVYTVLILRWTTCSSLFIAQFR